MSTQRIDVIAIVVNYANIPSEMRDVRQWVVWKYEKHNGKLKKVPYNPHNGRKAKSNEPATWGTLEEVIKAYKGTRYAGIGFMFDSGVAGVDLDQCRDKDTGEIEDWAMEIVTELDSYTEISPSGSGLHIFIKGELPGAGVNNRNWRGHKVEIYDSGRFFTFTGDHVEGTSFEAEERQEEIESLYNRVKRPKAKRVARSEREPLTLDDNEVMELALNAENGRKFERLWDGDTSQYPSASEADFALVNILCYWTQDDEQVARLWKDSRLYREKLERDDYIERTIAKARSVQTESYKPRSKTKRKVGRHSEVTSSKAEAYDPRISEDPEREAYLRKLLANSSRMTRARMMMVAALGFEKIPWRLLNGIHAFQRNKLGVRIITDERLQQVYRANGEPKASERTIRRDKKKLWDAQEKVGVELIGYWHGRQDKQTGKNYGSKYTSNLDRWVLMAIDLAITNNGNDYAIRDEQLKAACEEIASRVIRQPKQKQGIHKESADMMPEIMTLERQALNAGKRYKKLLEQLKSTMADAGCTGGEIYNTVEQIKAQLGLPDDIRTQVN